MAHVRMSLAEAATVGAADMARIEATTEDDIRRHRIEDGEDPDASLPGTWRVVHSPGSLRAALGLTQVEMAGRLRVPVATWRNWEQGRVALEPTVRALIALVADDPERAFRVLGTSPAAAA